MTLEERVASLEGQVAALTRKLNEVIGALSNHDHAIGSVTYGCGCCGGTERTYDTRNADVEKLPDPEET